VLHLHPGGPLQGLGHAMDVRLQAESVRDVPCRIQLPPRERAVLLRRRRRDAARGQYGRAWIFRRWMGAGLAQERAPRDVRAAHQAVAATDFRTALGMRW